MKKEIIIEEVISQKFEIDVEEGEDVYEKVRKMYRDVELILDSPSLVEANVLIDGNESWLSI